MFLEQVCGARLPIAMDDGPVGGHEIMLGDNSHPASTGLVIDFGELGDHPLETHRQAE